jgi:hypothetical protein
MSGLGFLRNAAFFDERNTRGNLMVLCHRSIAFGQIHPRPWSEHRRLIVFNAAAFDDRIRVRSDFVESALRPFGSSIATRQMRSLVSQGITLALIVLLDLVTTFGFLESAYRSWLCHRPHCAMRGRAGEKLL